MANIIDRLKTNLGRIYRILLFIVSCVVIIYFFPKSGKFKYSFENGRPWQSDNLYAPFDFAIKKSKEEIDKEKLQIKETSKQFYAYNEEVVLNVKKAIFTSVNNVLSKMEPRLSGQA